MATAYRPSTPTTPPMGDFDNLFHTPHAPGAPVAPPASPIFDTDGDPEAAALLAQLSAAIGEEAEATPDDESGQDAAQRLSIYGELTDLLVSKGVPRAEIAWIHDAKTPSDRETLFTKMRQGVVRVLIGSTFRMGVGVNVQERCYAVHHITTPWRPCDVKQADGRIWRPGNLFPEVWIFRYIAAPSFDGFSWQGIETKGRFEDAYLRGDPSVRVMQDIDEQIISAGEIKALASGDPRIVQKVRLEHELDKLKQKRSGWEGTRRGMRFKSVVAENDAATLRERISALQGYIDRRSAAQTLTLLGTTYDLSNAETHRALGKDIRDALITWGTTQSLTDLKRLGRIIAPAGVYRSLPMYVRLELDNQGKVKLPTLFLGTDGGERLTDATIPIGDRAEIIARMERAADDLDTRIGSAGFECERMSAEASRIRATLDEPWEHERTFRMMELGLRYLDAALNEDTTKTEAVIAEVLALAESEGLDIDTIIKEGQAIEEQGPDLSQIRVQLPPMPVEAPEAEVEVEAETLTLAPADETPRALSPARPATPSSTTPRPTAPPAPAAQGSYVSLSIFADPLPIARPTLEVATLDLRDMATEAARKKVELANKKRKQALDAGQASFI